VGNLGSYQDIVTEAHRLGGVDHLIESIEKAATTRAVPRAFAAGAGATMVLGLGAAAAFKAWSKHAARRKEEAEGAKECLADAISQPRASTRSDGEAGPDAPFAPGPES